MTAAPATPLPIVLYPGTVTSGRPTVEVHTHADGTHEAFLVPPASAPIPTGVKLFQKGSGKNWYVHCRIRKVDKVFKPEEVVRQKIINWLVDDLGYDENRIGVEVGIQMGGKVHDKPADIVVFTDATKSGHWVIIEVKKPGRKDGIEQLKSYMNPTAATFGYWTNGADERFLLRSGSNDYSKPIWRLPRSGETLDDVDEPITRSKLRPVTDLYAILKDLEQHILAHQTVDTFNEIFKLVFAKLFDERVNLPKASSVAQFRIGLTEAATTAAANVRKLFDRAKLKWNDVYDSADTIALTDENLAYCIKVLQGTYLMKSGDVLGLAFELLVNQEMKGEMGQYFTPRQVVDMMVKMIEPTIEETVCDPACGSGGFLIYTMRKVFQYIEDTWDDADDRAEQRKDYAQDKLVGMDNDARLVKVAKAYMIMENDGRGGLFSVDSLDYNVWEKRLKERVTGRKTLKPSDLAQGALVKDRLPTDGLQVILTNPPFAGAIKASTTLSQYSLALGKNGKNEGALVRAVLFLERCLDMLVPGGRMGIVLPQGLFNNITDQNIRTFIDQKARVLAVVGLHPYTFKPFTLAKTSVLFLQKWRENEYLPNYPVFTAVSMRPGKTKLGAPLYLEDGKTLDCDMDEIAEQYKAWKNSLTKNANKSAAKAKA
ncbi:N-6 DNA methylase [Burkholderia singularis]|uniref:N-6 DNA methylase n=1 Tax=Burkholderia singularis TaxID=1503053 RepID=UPI0009EAB438|nr:N-6 DNA methylase [Burkholderia singularis]